MMRVVRELPPSDSWSIRVSFESRYGMYLTYQDKSIRTNKDGMVKN